MPIVAGAAAADSGVSVFSPAGLKSGAGVPN
jgi:hypothetical protein